METQNCNLGDDFYQLTVNNYEEMFIIIEKIDQYISIILKEQKYIQKEEFDKYIKNAFISMIVLLLCDFRIKNISGAEIVLTQYKNKSIYDKYANLIKFSDIVYIDYDIFSELSVEKQFYVCGKIKFTLPVLLDGLTSDKNLSSKTLQFWNVSPKHPLYGMLTEFDMFTNGQPKTLNDLFCRLIKPDFDCNILLKFLVSQINIFDKLIQKMQNNTK